MTSNGDKRKMRANRFLDVFLRNPELVSAYTTQLRNPIEVVSVVVEKSWRKGGGEYLVKG